MRASAAPVLAGKIDLRMDDALCIVSKAAFRWNNAMVRSYHVPCQCIIARERFFFDAQCAAHLLLAHVVDCVLVPGEIIGSRKDGVAWLSGGGVDALALVRARLRVPFEQSR